VKPNREIYVKLFETFNIKPEERFFINDNGRNIVAAKKLGMKGVL